MKKIKIGRRLILIGLLIFLIENFYFGWNKHPMSDLELYADYIVKVFMNVGFIFYLTPLLDLYETAVKNNELSKKKNI